LADNASTTGERVAAYRLYEALLDNSTISTGDLQTLKGIVEQLAKIYDGTSQLQRRANPNYSRIYGRAKEILPKMETFIGGLSKGAKEVVYKNLRELLGDDLMKYLLKSSGVRPIERPLSQDVLEGLIKEIRIGNAQAIAELIHGIVNGKPVSTLDYINHAVQGDLEKIPGIGSVLAERIIANRPKGGFNDIKDLMNVPGIGPERLGDIITYFTPAVTTAKNPSQTAPAPVAAKVSKLKALGLRLAATLPTPKGQAIANFALLLPIIMAATIGITVGITGIDLFKINEVNAAASSLGWGGLGLGVVIAGIGTFVSGGWLLNKIKRNAPAPEPSDRRSPATAPVTTPNNGVAPGVDRTVGQGVSSLGVDRTGLPKDDRIGTIIPSIKLKLTGVLTSFTSGLAPPVAYAKALLSRVYGALTRGNKVGAVVVAEARSAEANADAQSATSRDGEEGQDVEGVTSNIGDAAI
jgi:hypothetical protein